MKKILILLLILTTGITVFTGCGGSTSKSKVVTFISVTDGNVFSSGLINDNGTEMGVGDNAVNAALQALLSFNLDLPANAQINSATLRLYNCDFPGTLFPSNILVEHLQTDFETIDPTDFADPAGLTSCGQFTTLVIGGWNELNVTASVQEDQTVMRGKSQFRLYRIPLTDNDGQWDNNSFYTSENETKQPELIVTYTI